MEDKKEGWEGSKGRREVGKEEGKVGIEYKKGVGRGRGGGGRGKDSD